MRSQKLIKLYKCEDIYRRNIMKEKNLKFRAWIKDTNIVLVNPKKKNYFEIEIEFVPMKKKLKKEKK